MTELTAAESRDLRCIAGMMIPASTEFDVPGADDAAIFADIIGTMGRDTALTSSRRPVMREESSIAGNDASDERVEMATVCGAMSPRAKVAMFMRPAIAASG